MPLHESVQELTVRPLKALFEMLKYLLTGRGAFSHPLFNICTFLPTRLLDPTTSTLLSAPAADLDASVPANRPDVEIMHLPYNPFDVDVPVSAAEGGIYALIATLLHPASEGTVRLETANPRARPAVDLGFFSNPADYVPLRAAVRFALRVARDVRAGGYPLRDLAVPRGAEEGAEGTDGPSDEDLDEFIRAKVRTCLHYTSTCRMGPRAGDSVVDAQLRVHGVRGLRVCDASVFPEIVGAHTMAAVVMVTERCADMIKLAWQ